MIAFEPDEGTGGRTDQEMSTSSDAQTSNCSNHRRPSDSSESKRSRYEKWKQAKNTRKARIDYYYCNDEDKTELLDKIKEVKTIMGDGRPTTVTTFEMLDRVLNFYIVNNTHATPDKDPRATSPMTTMDYQLASEEMTKQEDIFLCTFSALRNLSQQIQQHSQVCAGSLQFSQNKCSRLHHAVRVTSSCDNGHKINWTSSPYVMGGKLLVNLRMAHGYFTSGMLPIQYNKLCQEAHLGCLGEEYLENILKDDTTSYLAVAQSLSLESTVDALQEEIAWEEMCGGAQDGINIVTDARHCWRKNARFSDVVCLGQKTNKVIRVETISKKDDTCSQRHELVGVKRIYDYLDKQQCPVKTHAHDNNASVAKYIREERSPTESSKDTWHATKGIARDAKKISSGPRSQENKTWHPQLSDKAASIKTHIYYTMKNCNGDADKLRNGIDNIVHHYQGCHDNCPAESRCRTDNPYIPSKQQLTDPVAVHLLTNFLQKTVIYRNAESYRFCSDTHYVESFNNALLQYHDKRICFADEAYKLRTLLAILDWNEHINRPSTSVKTLQDVAHPRRKVPHRVLVKKTNQFKNELWSKWMAKMYNSNI